MHDTCSTVHALALASPFLCSLPLGRHGFEPVHPEVPLAHPLDDGSAVLLERSVADTARGLGPDERAYRRLFEPLVRDSERPVRRAARRRCARRAGRCCMARFGLSGLRSAVGLARSRFEDERARALLGGCAAHSMLSLRAPASAAFGLVLMLSAHAVGWPVARGGSQRLADALAAHLRELGGSVATGQLIESLDELPPGAGRVLLDLAPRGLLALAGGRLPERYRRAARALPLRPGRLQARLGARRPDPVARARGGARRHRAPGRDARRDRRVRARGRPTGEHPERPFVLLVQPSLFDASARARGQAHRLGLLPRAERLHARHDRGIEAQVERFAPGFRDLIAGPRTRWTAPRSSAATRTTSAATITGGSQDLRQLFTRPVARPVPYSTPVPGPVHLLGVHAAGRRRPRDVRLLGRPRRAAPLLLATAPRRSGRAPAARPVPERAR